MILTGPSPVIFGATTAQVMVVALQIDPFAGKLTVTYANPINPLQQKEVSGLLSASDMAAIAQPVANLVQQNEGWVSPPAVNTKAGP